MIQQEKNYCKKKLLQISVYLTTHYILLQKIMNINLEIEKELG